ncbi:hypothetical protein ACFOPX_04505 [Helicobacter baculiformis]|uniref:Periplasmic protein n=1 Tax=Helicobacter baculiformis TaxID=427351 RepID=A0ABV7ZI24_9HELI|nr:hypothetical protein [Helicobacter baculiformis]
MGDLWFYAIYWSAGFFLAFPIFIIGLIYTYFQPPPPRAKPPSLKDLLSKFKILKTQEDFEAILENFTKHYTIFPKDAKEGDWLELIEDIAESEYIDIDSTIKFGHDLENANPKLSKSIANTIGLALKHKKKD